VGAQNRRRIEKKLIQELQWEVPEHPPYSPDMASNDVHPLEKHPGGKRFADDEKAKREVRKWLRQQSKDFYAAGFDALVKRWDTCISVGGGYKKVKK
jgi:hypothetical protein